MTPDTGHPSEAELLAFNRGELDESSLNSVGQHIEQCPACCEHLHQLAERDRQLLWLRGLAIPSDAGTLKARGDDLAETQHYPIDATPDQPCLDYQRGRRLDAVPPATLGNYELLGEIARGGMGIVFKARHGKLNRIVALKVTRAGQLATAEETKRFQQEAEAAAKLDHRHIVPIYEIGDANGQHFIAMALVEGGSLAKAVASGPLPPHRAADIVRKMADAVAYAHGQGVIHRDLKPANVLLDGAGEPRVTDFGLAKCAEIASVLTHTGQVIGTPSFMPPEQAEGKIAQVGPAADVYSLGATLYCLLTGHPPFQAASTLDTLKQVVEQPPVPPQQINAAVDRDLDTICMKCLEKRPEMRYTSATALADDLARFLDGRPILARRVGGAERCWRWCRRNPTVAGLAAMLLLSMLAGVAGVVWQWQIAVGNERKAQDLAKLERWERYRSNMAEASIALQQQDVESARRAILGAPEEYRGWEWRFFVGQLDGSLKSLQITTTGTGPDTSVAAVHPTRWQIAIPWPDGNVRFWDPNGAPPPGLPRAPGKTNAVTAHSPDGKLLAVSADDFSIHLWNTETGKRLHILHGHKNFVVNLIFSNDSVRLASASGGGEGKVCIWDTKEGNLLYRGPGVGIALFPDGKGLAICEDKQLTYTPNVVSKTPPRIFAGHTARIGPISVRPDGRQLASAGVYPENKIRLWDVTTGKETAVLAGHGNYLYQMAYSPDGCRLASASHDMTVGLWDTNTGKLLHRLAGHGSPVAHVAFSPDGTRLASSSAETARLWDTESGDLLAVLRGHRGPLTSIRFSHDGSRIVTTGADGSLRIWDARLAEAFILRGHTSFVYDVAVSPDGALVASTGWDGTLRLWDAATGRPVRQMKHDAAIVSTAAFDTEGRRIVTLSRHLEGGKPGRFVTVWDVRTGERLQTIRLAVINWSDSHTPFHPNRNWIAVGDLKDTLRLLDAASGAELKSLRGQKSVAPDGLVTDVAFSPDGAQLACGDRDGNVRLWSPDQGIESAILRGGHNHGITRLVYSCDGKRLASASDDRTVRIWDVATRQSLAELPHGNIVFGLAFSPDGARLATGCADKTVRLWSLETYQEVGVLRGHTDYVHAVAFSPDGRRLVSASGDFTVRIWDSGDAGISR